VGIGTAVGVEADLKLEAGHMLDGSRAVRVCRAVDSTGTFRRDLIDLAREGACEEQRVLVRQFCRGEVGCDHAVGWVSTIRRGRLSVDALKVIECGSPPIVGWGGIVVAAI
jgi:hypothetical protein